jgi:tetratricopeptide (TPR) repeat protein
MKWLFLLAPAFLLISCNDNDEAAAPGEEVLSQAPYSTITDSLKREPKNAELYFRRAILLNTNNLPDLALLDFQHAWAQAKQEKYAVGISNILLDKKSDSLIAFMNEALGKLPESLLLRLALVRAYDARNMTDSALAACDHLLATEPDQVNTLMLKASLLEKKEDTSGMISVLEKAHRLLPANLEVTEKLAYQYAESKNSKALALADSLIMIDTLLQHPDAYYIKGMYYSNINDRANAISLFDQTIRHDHRYLNAYIEKGKIQLNQKKTAEAFKTFELANTVSPAFPDAWFWMGKCQEAMGQKEDAKLNYEKAYGLDKTFTEAKEAAEKL